MTTSQKIIATSAVLVLLGVFITSDFGYLTKKPAKKEGQVGADGTNADPYMMLEVDESQFPNASGNKKCLTINDITKK